MENLEQNELEIIMTNIRERFGLKHHHVDVIDALYDLKKLYEAQLESYDTPGGRNKLSKLESIIQDLEHKTE